MNRTPPPVGEKVPGGRLRGIPTGSWSQCVCKKRKEALHEHRENIEHRIEHSR